MLNRFAPWFQLVYYVFIFYLECCDITDHLGNKLVQTRKLMTVIQNHRLIIHYDSSRWSLITALLSLLLHTLSRHSGDQTHHHLLKCLSIPCGDSHAGCMKFKSCSSLGPWVLNWEQSIFVKNSLPLDFSDVPPSWVQSLAWQFTQEMGQILGRPII